MLIGNNKVNDDSKTYTKQIHVYSGKIYAEIIYQDKETEYNYASKLWCISLSKEFGSNWSSSVKEKDLIKAHNWADEQLILLNKYAINKLEKANVIKNYIR